MIKFFIVIFLFFILMVLMLGFSVVRTIGRVLFGSSSHRNEAQRRRQQQKKQQTKEKRSSSHKKIFGKDEGEYIDYEEVDE